MSRFLNELVIRALSPAMVRERGSDRQLYQLESPFSLELDWAGGVLMVPPGYVTDFASIPRGALWYIDDDDPAILGPSVVHDWIYSNRGVIGDGRIFSRQQADQVIRDGMLLCGARRDQAAVVYAAVRTFGGSHWKA